MATLWNMGGLTWRDLTRRVWSELSEDSILGWSAQLSFYFLLSIFPTLFFLLVLFGYFVGQGTQIRVALIGYLGALAPESAVRIEGAVGAWVRTTVRDRESAFVEARALDVSQSSADGG